MEKILQEFEEANKAIDDLMIALYEIKKIFQEFIDAFSTEGKPNQKQ